MGGLEWFIALVTGGSVLFAIISAICAMIVPVVIIGGVIYLITRQTGRAREVAAASMAWPSTSGTVVRSFVEVSGGGGDSAVSHFPRVIYEYEVGGTTYRSSQLRAGDQFARKSAGSHMAAMEVTDRYPEGSSVTVYYNPANPGESALIRDTVLGGRGTLHIGG